MCFRKLHEIPLTAFAFDVRISICSIHCLLILFISVDISFHFISYAIVSLARVHVNGNFSNGLKIVLINASSLSAGL